MKAVFENNALMLPKEIIKKLKFKNKQNLKVEIIDEETIKIKTIKEDPDKHLLSYLDRGFHMGKVLDLSREKIYEDID